MNFVKIKSYKEIDSCDVFDIEVPETHNFILENGIIAHNCSHSISYAYIGYIEAWWKLNYPEYYWLGKLTAFQDKTDKMLTYMEEARRFILQPCIIRSHPYEWKTENGRSEERRVGKECRL